MECLSGCHPCVSSLLKNVPPYTIVGGVPARPIRKRFNEDTIRKLEALKWWNWPAEKIRRCLPYIVNGDINKLILLQEINDQP